MGDLYGDLETTVGFVNYICTYFCEHLCSQQRKDSREKKKKKHEGFKQY